jgi:hypothetical protein
MDDGDLVGEEEEEEVRVCQAERMVGYLYVLMLMLMALYNPDIILIFYLPACLYIYVHVTPFTTLSALPSHALPSIIRVHTYIHIYI